jgi:hypothetical protein
MASANTQPDPGQRFLSVDDVTNELPIAKATLAKWRWNGSGPAFVKLGARVMYRRADLDAWIAGNTRSPAAANA